MDEKVVAGSSTSSSQKRATLDAGRKKLEEFRKKKEAQQEMRSQQAKLVDAQPILADKAKEREEELKQQCAELLASVDDLHRALNDERYNSSQLEGTIADLRREMSMKVQEKAEQDDRVVELEGELSELVGQLEGLVKEREDRDKETSLEDVDVYKCRIKALEEELIAQNEQQSNLKGEIAELTLRLEELAKDKSATEERNARMEAELGERSAESKALIEKIASLEAEVAKAAENASHADTSDQLLERLEVMSKDKETLMDASAKMEAELTSASELLEDAIKQKEAAEKELAEVVGRIADLEASYAALATAPTAPDPRVEQEIAALKAANASLQAKLQASQSAILQSSDLKQKDDQLASLSAELSRVKDSLAAEKRRGAQLEELAASQSAGNKKLDDDHDMEAAALTGGGAFKPLVGIVRSLPPTLGNNAFINEAAKKLDKAAVALDARPAIRAAVILYIALLHLILLI